MTEKWRSFREASRTEWGSYEQKDADVLTVHMQLGALQRIADACEGLLRILECRNFQLLPHYLRQIRNHTKPRKAGVKKNRRKK